MSPANLSRIGALAFARKFCAAEGCSLEEVLGERRHPRIVRARHRLWMILRDTLGFSYPELGAVFGKNHTSIMHGVKKCRAHLEEENEA